MRIRLKGQGGHGSRPELNGDLYLTIHFRPNGVFAVSGRDVRCQLPVWDYEAALGAEVTAPTLDGRVALKIPAGSQTGRVMRLKGRGIPGRRQGRRGRSHVRTEGARAHRPHRGRARSDATARRPPQGSARFPTHARTDARVTFRAAPHHVSAAQRHSGDTI